MPKNSASQTDANREIRDALRAQYPGRWSPLVVLVESRGKRPIALNWNAEAVERFANGADVSEHLARVAEHLHRGGNVGLAIPPGVVVLDADTREADDWLRARIPGAPRQATAKGAHYVLRLRDGVRLGNRARVEISSGVRVDVRAAGLGQIVAAPSVHKSGHVYAWTRGLPESIDELPELPESILAKIAEKPEPLAAPADGEKINAGSRNATLASLAGTMRRRGMASPAIEAALLAENAERCDPPLSVAEVSAIARSIGSYQPPDLTAELAGLSELEYHQRRAELAKAAQIGVGALDDVRREARRKARSIPAAAAKREPWPEPVNGAALIAGVEAALRRFVVLSKHAYVLVALWCLGTHLYRHRNVWPLLLARSPQPACGKSTLLDLLERLVADAFAAGNASLATLFRKAATGGTQLLDELDRWLERDPEVVGYLCAGWQSGRPFTRCAPETFELQEFSCYVPKALALIGDLADEALRSRCIVIEMRRALPGERPSRFRAGRPYPELAELHAKAMRWAIDNAETVAAFELGESELPGLSGRAADNAEALLSVAEAIGAECSERCREALLNAPTDESQDLGAMLLADLLPLVSGPAEAVSTVRILEHLVSLTDRPWLTVGKSGKALEANGLRRRLAPFGIKPDRHSIDGAQVRGYATAPIREAAQRYLPPSHAPGYEPSKMSSCLKPPAPEALAAPRGTPIRHLLPIRLSQLVTVAVTL